jgi:glycosyltransferase involved in cell wall biosynthesis
MEWDIKNMGLENIVILIESTPEPIKIMSCFDVFFLSSREDPYPLVVLEAAMMEIPSIVYEKSGGATEFVSEECGLLINYINSNDTVAAIKQLKEDSELRNRLAVNARKKYLALHTKEKVYQVFQSCLITE